MARRISAKLRFLAPEEGGRKSPPGCGFAQPLCFGARLNEFGQPILSDCFIFVAGHTHRPHSVKTDHQLPLGEEFEADVYPLVPDLVAPHAEPGSAFEVWSPLVVHAKGTIVSVEEVAQIP